MVADFTDTKAPVDGASMATDLTDSPIVTPRAVFASFYFPDANMRSSTLNVVAAAAVALAGLSSAANVTEWKSQSIYQVMIDRFARTDGSTTHECELHKFCGGTWTGLINNLDYIQGMGFTAIQISPVIKNMEDDTTVGEPYHGYWSEDLFAINEHFGTASDLKNLAAELHKRDMLLMVDVVVNHMAQKFDNVIPPKVDFTEFNPFNSKDYFHPYCNVTMWENTTDYQNCWLYPFGVALADLKTETPKVQELFNGWVKDLVSNYSIDGLRIDAAKHVNDDFLPSFVEASGVFAFGEVLTGVTEDMCRYQTKGLLPGMPNYLEFYPLNAAFNGGSFVDVARMRNEAATGCNDTFALGSFIENHDMPRFPSLNNDLALAKNVLTYIMLTDGIPTVYQGQEQHFSGSETPANREPLWQSAYDKTAPLYVLTATLNKVRQNAMKLSDNYLETAAETLWADVNHFCLKKGPFGTQVVFCINNKSSKGDSYEVSIGGFQPNDNVVEVIGCTTVTADATGNVTMYMGMGEPKVYVNKATLDGTGLCTQTTPDGPKANKNGAPSALGVTGGVVFAVVLGWATLFL
ncbi:glycoside hydrolase family 13 protein [Apodospora peruviana]|uniref:alpha-amylase n=1 Tax=Apodospora peruviana TaxID=516989 RepID=A0AAE0M8D7_9PEZI|nr:glycoside hydrolase family 13 protein [Apodospora peruviana]